MSRAHRSRAAARRRNALALAATSSLLSLIAVQAWAQATPSSAEPPVQQATPGGPAPASSAGAQAEENGAISAAPQPAAPPASTGPAAPVAQPPEQGAVGGPTVSEVVVTGTRIRGVGPVGSSVIPVGQDEIVKTGVATTGDVLRDIPQVLEFGGGEDYSGGSIVQGSTRDISFAKTVNLRGIGSGATLSLVDGHRVAPGNIDGSLFDADNIPEQALQRIEVVADGASAIYGSDAIAGVVNYVLRKPFDGLEATARFGGASDVSEHLLGFVGGKTWDFMGGGGVMIAYENYYRGALSAAARPNLYNSDLSPYGGPPATDTANPGNVIINGVEYPIPFGQNGQNFTLASLGTAGQVNRENIWTGTEGLPRQDRNSGVMEITQRVTNWLQLFGEGYYSQRDYSIAQWAATEAPGLEVPDTNPYSPCAPGKSTANNQGIVCPADGTVTVPYSFINDLGPQNRSGSSRSYAAIAGANITLPLDWKGSVSLTYSRDYEFAHNQNVVNGALLNAAVTGVGKPASVPFLNPFCDGTAFACNSPATLASFSAFNDEFSRYAFSDVQGGFDGPLFHLPGGEVRLAVGGEAHHDRLASSQFGNNFLPSLDTLVFPVVPSSRDVEAGYGELYVPIFGPDNAIPFFKKLDLSAAVRHEHYSDFGGTTNPKIGINWTPFDGLQLHGSYGTSFHAPTLQSIDAYAAAGFLYYQAPSSAIGVTAAAPSTLAALFQVGGQAGLQPETATTWSGGFDWQPPSIRGLDVSLNYYNIDYTNKIDTATYNAGLVAALTDPIYYPFINFNPMYYPTLPNGVANPLTQAQFNAILAADTSNPRLPVLLGPAPTVAQTAALLDGRSNNEGTIDTDGFDLAARYAFHPTPWGDFHVGFAGQYVLHYTTAVTPAAPLVENVNNFTYPLRFRSRSEIGWDYGNWSASLFWNFQNGYTVPRSYLPASVPDQYMNVESYSTIDATVIYNTKDTFHSRYLDNITVVLAVQNLFDSDPPLVVNVGAESIRFDPSEASPLGRSASIQVSKRF